MQQSEAAGEFVGHGKIAMPNLVEQADRH